MAGKPARIRSPRPRFRSISDHDFVLKRSVSPNGRYLYILRSDNSIQELAMGADNTLTAVGAAISGDAGDTLRGLAFSPDGAHAYLAETNIEASTSLIRSYTVGSNGALTTVGSPFVFPGGTALLGIGLLPTNTTTTPTSTITAR